MAIRKATLASRWMSVSDISARLMQARDNRERQRKLLDTLEGQATAVAKRSSAVWPTFLHHIARSL